MRHIRDKHNQKRKCPFCRTKWTRPERIRTHVLKSHRSLLSENDQDEIYHLRGIDDTIRFLAQYGNMPSENSAIYAVGLPQPLGATVGEEIVGFHGEIGSI
jgi:hypothetical protein